MRSMLKLNTRSVTTFSYGERCLNKIYLLVGQYQYDVIVMLACMGISITQK